MILQNTTQSNPTRLSIWK